MTKYLQTIDIHNRHTFIMFIADELTLACYLAKLSKSDLNCSLFVLLFHKIG